MQAYMGSDCIHDGIVVHYTAHILVRETVQLQTAQQVTPFVRQVKRHANINIEHYSRASTPAAVYMLQLVVRQQNAPTLR